MHSYRLFLSAATTTKRRRRRQRQQQRLLRIKWTKPERRRIKSKWKRMSESVYTVRDETVCWCWFFKSILIESARAKESEHKKRITKPKGKLYTQKLMLCMSMAPHTGNRIRAVPRHPRYRSMDERYWKWNCICAQIFFFIYMDKRHQSSWLEKMFIYSIESE